MKKSIDSTIKTNIQHFWLLLIIIEINIITKNDECCSEVSDFNCKMTNNAYNIRTSDKYYQKKLKDYYDIRLNTEDEAFYCDNCCDTYMCHMFTYLIF